MSCARLLRSSIFAGVLSPITGALVLHVFAYTSSFIRVHTGTPPEVERMPALLWLLVTIVYAVVLLSLPATIFSAIGLSTLLALRNRGRSPHSLFIIGTVLGAGCGLLVSPVWMGGFHDPYTWTGAVNGAMWGLLIAHRVLKNQAAPQRGR